MEEERESKKRVKKCCGNVHFRSGTEIAQDSTRTEKN